MRIESKLVLRWLQGASLLVVAATASAAQAQTAADATPDSQQAGDPVPDATGTGETGEDIVVTGFRSSLAKALDAKRSEAAATDSILAEDIGKFPDLNLSESIQRIPGVALARDGGEGRQISVRGLGPQFTRVRINGLEAIATAGGADASGGTNRGRGFDFNVFAADLFNAITVRKTAEAVTEEGSLGATVDLRTARPFDYNGFTLSASAQGSYNDLSNKLSPRGAFMIADTFADGRLGALFSVAYTKRRIIESGFSTVRWASNDLGVSPGFESALGTPCLTASGARITPAPAACAQANAALHPRFPRYDYFIGDQERLGATASLQWRPSDRTLLSLDGLYADFKATREERFLEANGFSVAGACTAASRPTNCGVADTNVTTATYDGKALIAGTFDDVDLRVENRFDELDTKFRQLTFEASQEFGDSLSVSFLAGHSSSDHENPVQNTVTFDQFNVDNYSYDYTDRRKPVFGFGTANLAGPEGWVLSQLRLRSATAKNTYDTIQANLRWDVAEGFEILAGGSYKKYSFETSELRRSNGTTASQDANVACCRLPGDTLDKFGRVVEIEGTRFFAPNYFLARDYFGLEDPTARGGTFKLGPEPAAASNNSVKERDKSAYLQFNFDRDFGFARVRGNAGVRYVETNQRANGFSFVAGALTPIVAERTYEDWLPSANLVFEPTENFLIRASAARVMARPDLGSLPPSATVGVSGANRTVSVGNPNLDPYRASTYDLAFEYYHQRGALISVALFQKDIDSFVQTVTSSGTYSSNPFGLPDSLAIAACGSLYPDICNPAHSNWTFSAPRNSPGGRLRGYEINFQQPLRFLPGFLSNTGVLLNYTHVTSKIQYLNSTGGVAAINDLTGLSRNGANGTVYYEDKVFSARVSAAYRSGYLTDAVGRQGTDEEGTNSTLNVDASLQFTVSKNLKLSLEAVNLTDEYQDQYVDSSNLLNVYHHTGREFLVGVRYTF